MTDKSTAATRRRPATRTALDAEAKAKQAHADANEKAAQAQAELDATSEKARVELDNERQIRDGNVVDPEAPAVVLPDYETPKRATINSHSVATKQGWTKVIDDERDSSSNRPYDDYRGVMYEKQIDGSAHQARGATEEEALTEVEQTEVRAEQRRAQAETSFLVQ